MVAAILKGLVLGFILILSVGPIVFTIIKQSLNHGPKGGFSFVSGVWVSDILLVCLANAFTALVSTLLQHQRAIAYGGSAFLIALGVYFVFFKKVHLVTDKEGNSPRFRKRDMARVFASGFLINTLNPGVIIFWLGNATVLAIDHTLQERIVIFSVCLLINMGADAGKVLLAGKLRNRLTLHTLKIVNRISGTILIGFGCFLLYSALFMIHKHG